ncbi:MAG: DUF4867 family protein, partial [Clostridia bacterium]|nr:DUF4867 family protein [Clostridia bacterium]
RDSEFNLGTDDFILLLGRQEEIVDGIFDTANVRAFRVPAGTYSPADFVFGAEDCAADCRVVYEAAPGAVIHGGVTIGKEQWKTPDAEMLARFPEESRGAVRMVSLPEAGLDMEKVGGIRAIGAYEMSSLYDDAEKGCGCEVFCSDRRMTLARFPNAGEFAKLEAVADVGDVYEFPPQNYRADWFDRRNQRGGAYIFDRAMAAHAAKWKNPDEAWMFGYFYWDWADSSTPCHFDVEHRTVYPKYVSRFGARAGALYYFYNVPEELDIPGEWYLDRETGNLYFYPQEGGCSLDFSYSDQPLISCENTVNMTFSGFTCLCSMADAVTCSGDNMIFRGLMVKNVAGNAIICQGKNNLVDGCEITHTGKGGITLEGGERDTLTHGNNRACNNYVHDFSEIYLTYQPGIRLNGVGNMADHNEISGSPHMAIGYSGNEHLIEYNDIHDVVLQSSDAGAIYSGFGGAGHGTVSRYNRLRHIGEAPFTPDGIYWDDGLSGQTAYGNLLIGVGKFGFLVGGGRENVVEGNVIIGNGNNPIHYDDRDREGFVHGGWARAATNKPDAPHWKKLASVPFRSSVWAEKYPILAKVITDFYHDPDDPDYPVNPAYSSVQGNVIIDEKERLGHMDDSVYTYSTVKDNLVFADRAAAGWDDAAERFSEGSPVFEKLPGFAAIPVEKIGRGKG